MPATNLLTPQNTQSGVAEKLFVAPLSFFAPGGIKEPTPPFLFDGAEVVIFESHELLEGKFFIEIALPPEKNDLTDKTFGDKGFQKFQQEIKCIIAGSYPVQHELIKNLLNQPLIALISDSDCGANLIYQIGTGCVPAYLSCDFSTGTTRDGIKGYAATITCTNEYQLIYAGELTLATKYLITETGEFVMTEDDQFIDVSD